MTRYLQAFGDPVLAALVTGVLAVLVVASVVGAILSRRVTSPSARATVGNLNARVRAWWVMAGVFAGAVTMGTFVSVGLFCVISFLALREFVTLTPTRAADHRALFWSFFIITPIQYFLVWIRWYSLFSILIPVYGSMFLAVRTVSAGDTERFLERTATTQWGLMICVYFVCAVKRRVPCGLKGAHLYEPLSDRVARFPAWCREVPSRSGTRMLSDGNSTAAKPRAVARSELRRSLEST